MRKLLFSAALVLTFTLPSPSARAIVDLDQDGLSDLWEAIYGHGLDPAADDDGDGSTNLQESIEGTDPHDPASNHPVPAVQVLPHSTLRFSWPSVPGKHYQLQGSFDSEATWVGIGAPVMATGAAAEKIIAETTTFLGTGPTLSRYLKLADTPILTPVKLAVAHRVVPALTETIPTVEMAQTSPNLDHYGQFVRGWILPPATGAYTFWTSGDDAVEFYLSANSTPQLKRLLAFNTQWTPFRTWDWRKGQQSVPVTLRAGQLYYFELYQHEFGGGDQFSLAWTGPGLKVDKEVVDGAYVASSTETLYRKLATNPNPAWRLVVTDGDSDSDGLTDTEELLVGLDPFNAKSVSRTPDLETLTAMLAAPNVVTVGAETARAFEAEQRPARFTFFRSGNVNAFTAHFTVDGTAQAGADYDPLSGSVEFAVGQKSATVEVRPDRDGLFEPAETVTATVTADTGYQVGSPGSATVTIDDAANVVYVATLRPIENSSDGYGSAAMNVAGNQAFADLAVSFGHLSSDPTAIEVVILQLPGGPAPVLSFPLGQVSAFHWTFDDGGGFTRQQILDALAQGKLGVRISTSLLPNGELLAPFIRDWGWKTMPVPTSPGAALPRARTDGEAARFLMQASFGPTAADVVRLRQTTYAAWLEAQFAAPPTLAYPYVHARRVQLLARSKGQNDGYQTTRQEAWWQAALGAPDQLRQRVAFALSEIMVVSDVGDLGGQQEGLANYYDLLVRNAFGNYRTLLGQVTLSPMMGQYLSMARNQKPNPDLGSEPDENYAREVMQLFSLGLNLLNRDGSLALSAQGLPTPTYGQSDIVGLAHVFTGWGSWFNPAKPPKDVTGFYRYADIDPLHFMVQFPQFHDLKAKAIVGGAAIPAGQDGAADLRLALDTIFNHQNVAPFIARELIQRLVTSNPSRGYIYRVASAFTNNGAGVRGDLKATVRAILLDPEARNPVFTTYQTGGKLREPLLRVTELLRAFHPAPPLPPDPRYFIDQSYTMPYQTPQKSPSVFNFFQPNFLPPGRLAAAGLYAPEFQITQETTAISMSNQADSLLQYGIWTPEKNAKGQNAVVKLNLAPYVNLLLRKTFPAEQNQAAVLSALNNLLLGGAMSPGLAQSITGAWAGLPSWFDQSPDRQTDRVRLAIYLIVASPEFAVQK